MVDILITNDDGIDAPGLRVMHEVLSDIGAVVAVAPQTDHSGIGRILSYGSSIGSVNEYETYQLDFERHEHGYGVDGTPCDCVIAGLNAVEIDPDIVVSGCNPGANCGDITAYRSGTVAAAVEAAHLGTPSIAVSVEKPPGGPDTEDYRTAANVTGQLIEFASETGLFETVDYLNVNVPSPRPDEMTVEITEPVPFYEITATADDQRFTIQNTRYQQFVDGSMDAADGTDLRALKRGNLSVTPLGIPESTCDPGPLARFTFEP